MVQTVNYEITVLLSMLSSWSRNGKNISV